MVVTNRQSERHGVLFEEYAVSLFQFLYILFFRIKIPFVVWNAPEVYGFY